MVKDGKMLTEKNFSTCYYVVMLTYELILKRQKNIVRDYYFEPRFSTCNFMLNIFLTYGLFRTISIVIHRPKAIIQYVVRKLKSYKI